MRYYAGNWAYSVWLFKGESYRKLERMKMPSPWVYHQLDRFYDKATAVGLVSKVVGFRMMHLHGRALSVLVPKAVGRVEDYEWVDGEILAGMVFTRVIPGGPTLRESFGDMADIIADYRLEEMVPGGETWIDAEIAQRIAGATAITPAA